MSFATQEFIAFLAVIFILYYALPKKAQWELLLIGSFVFYCFAGWHCLVYITVTILSTFFAGKKISSLAKSQDEWMALHKEELSKDERKAKRAKDKSQRKLYLILAMLFNFGILGVLKYTGFALGMVGISFKGFAAVMGISFYTFQSMGYLLDVFWGRCEPQENLFKFALFVSFFPQLIQGPISRYKDLSETLYGEHEWNSRGIARGAERVIWGFAKKLIIADRLAIPLKALIADPESYNGIYVVAVILIYAAQLYADFTGGIDITIGIANMFGIELAENFNRPFFSKNTEEYWRRWHITMGTWFKDYVFYPMSMAKGMLKLHQWCKAHLGAFGKKVTVYLTTLILWFVTGIWHGASWNFIVWGLLNGIVILVSQECEPLYAKFHGRFPGLKEKTGYKFFQIIRTFILMSSIRIFDVYRNVPLTFQKLGSIFTSFGAKGFLTGMGELGLVRFDWVIAFCGIILMTIVSLLGRKKAVRDRLLDKPFLAYGACTLGIICILLLGVYGIGYDSTQFIYNQF